MKGGILWTEVRGGTVTSHHIVDTNSSHIESVSVEFIGVCLHGNRVTGMRHALPPLVYLVLDCSFRRLRASSSSGSEPLTHVYTMSIGSSGQRLYIVAV